MGRGADAGDEPWYVRAFGARYLDLYAHRDDSAAAREIAGLLRALGADGRPRTLDLCCGAGRHSAALAALGLRAIGLDLSPALLRRARALALEVVRGDMRRLPFRAGCLDLVLQLFTSFGYFADEAENRAVAAEVARTLAPGGRYVLDLMNKGRVLRELVPRSEERRGQDLWIQERRYDRARGRVEKRVERRDAEGRSETWTESVAVFDRTEIEALLERVGLRPTCCWGDFDGRAFDADSPRMILVAAR